MLSDVLRGLGAATAICEALRRAMMRLTLMLVALTFLLTGIGYAMATAYCAALREWGPVIGGLAMSGGALGIALVLFLIATRKRKPAPSTHQVPLDQVAAGVIAVVVMALSMLSQRRSETAGN